MLAILTWPFGVRTGTLPTAAAGWCTHCQREHRLARTPEAEQHALALLASIDAAGRFDFEEPTGEKRFQTEACTGGKMLGVLTCEGGTVLRAFSGMLGGSWHCPGWVGPVASLTLEDTTASVRFARIVEHVQLAKEASDEPARIEHSRIHGALSAELSTDLAASVVLRNWRGDEVALPDLLERRQQQLPTTRRPPWGVGDCAAPKLLHAAHALGLRPTGLAELWHAPPAPNPTLTLITLPIALALALALALTRHEPPSRRGSRGPGGSSPRRREHGSLHPACQERCEPIMGFLLCGLEDGAPDPRTLLQ